MLITSTLLGELQKRGKMKRRYSIKTKITIFSVAILTGIILLILFLNSTFSESYYQNTKEKSMLEAYKKVDFIVQQYRQDSAPDGSSYAVAIESSTIGMTVFIDDYTGVYDYLFATNNNPHIEINPNSIVIEKNDKYILEKVYDSRLSTYYLQLSAILTTNDPLYLRVPIQSIKDSVSITNTFIQYVGLGAILLGVIIIYIFSNYITKPIKQLSTIAGRMADLDFEAKYTGTDKGELGLLGNSMNYMSSKLQENISQLKSANIELKKDIEKKIQIDEMRKDFLSNVSHELKTPIALIQGYAEGLKEGISEDPESMDFYCDVIMDESNKMNNMVKKLLTLNQLEFGNEELVMERFDITELIRSIVNANEIRATQKDIKMIFEDTQPVYVWSDEYKIEEVITNYISNAINHCDFEKQIQIQLIPKGDVVRVSVFNTGKNIPDEDINNIWIKFYKVDKARTREYGGNGIGLSIVKAILDSYDKQCGVINHENGVEFWFELDCNKE